MKKAIIHSSKDLASLNIREKLFKLLDLKEKNSKKLNNNYFVNQDFLVYTTEKSQLNLDDFDERLNQIEEISHLIFPSKHSGEKEKKTFSVHAPGNPTEEAQYGGQKLSLSKSAPIAMKKSLMSLEKNKKKANSNYDVTLECTHHGPSEINIPSFFIEIGSSKNEWTNDKAGEVVAKSITSLKRCYKKEKSFVSFGGGHYSPRQTRLLLGTEISIGHIIPIHDLKKSKNDFILKESIRKTPNCNFIHLTGDYTRKKDFLKKLDNVKLPLFKEKEIRNLDPIPPKYWQKIQNTKKGLVPVFSGEKKEKLSLEVFNEDLVRYLERINRKKFLKAINKNNLLYFKYQNGEISNHFYFPYEELRKNRRKFIKDCIKIISQERDIDIKEKNKGIRLDIIERRFNPKKAKELGIKERQFGILTDGNSIEVGGNTITPAMVHNINKKGIDVSYCPTKKYLIDIN